MPAMFDPSAQENRAFAQKESMNSGVGFAEHNIYLLNKLGGETFVRVDMENPRSRKREVVLRPIALGRIILKRVLVKGSSRFSRDFSSSA